MSISQALPMTCPELAAELAVADGDVFDRLALRLIRVLWPAATGTPRLHSWDRRGADHLVWSDAPPFPLVVQCKGFQVQQLGRSQIDQCIASIRSFQTSGLYTDTYLLVHNRDEGNAAFQAEVQALLDDLVQSDQARRAEVWGRHRLVREALGRMCQRVQQQVWKQSAEIARLYAGLEPDLCPPIKEVPLQITDLAVNLSRLKWIAAAAPQVADPIDEILGESRHILLLGEFGFGKTIAALRAFQEAEEPLLYLPGAQITGGVSSLSDFLNLFVSEEKVLAGHPEEDWATLRKLLACAIPLVLEDPASPLILVVDGLDESSFVAQRGGLQRLFHQLRAVAGRVVFTARREFWDLRVDDFTTAYGLFAAAGSDDEQLVRVTKVDLLPWTDEQMQLLAVRYRDQLADSEARTRLNDLITVIEQGCYGEYFGDIPRRPLFLRSLLEWVAASGLGPLGRARLLDEWVTMKIRRDLLHPIRVGGEGRPPIVSGSEGLGATEELARTAMEAAAARMVTRLPSGAVELQADSALAKVLACSPALATVADPTGLVLNSLLLPVAPRQAGRPVRVRFAHRAFQEFFLACHVARNPSLWADAELPPSIVEWIDALARERILG